MAQGLTLAARERVSALLPSGGVSRWSHQLLTATTLIYANGAGITMAADTRLTLKGLTGGVTMFPAWGRVPALLPS